MVWTFLKDPVGSWLRVFAATIIAAALADLTEGDVDLLNHWQTYLVAGVAAVLPVIVAWINPADPRFGRGSA